MPSLNVDEWLKILSLDILECTWKDVMRGGQSYHTQVYCRNKMSVVICVHSKVWIPLIQPAVIIRQLLNQSYVSVCWSQKSFFWLSWPGFKSWSLNPAFCPIVPECYFFLIRSWLKPHLVLWISPLHDRADFSAFITVVLQLKRTWSHEHRGGTNLLHRLD